MRTYELPGDSMRTLAVTGLRELRLLTASHPPPAGPGEVTLRTMASGLGLTQLHILEGRTHRGPLPRVLGHEIVGHELTTGRYVLVDPIVGCGKCRYCQSGSDQLCDAARHLGMKVDGGWADLVNVPASHVFPLPDTIEPDVAVLTASALPTAVHAVRRAGVEAGMTVAVVGLGSVGNLVAQTARAFGATRVVAADVRPRSELGDATGVCDEYVQLDPATSGRDALSKALGGVGADVVVEAAGSAAALQLALASARPGGTVVAVGVVAGAVSIAFDDYVGDFLTRELSFRSSRSYCRLDFPLAIELVRSGRVDMRSMIGKTLAPEEVPSFAQEMLHRGTGGKRHVVRFDMTA